MKSATPVLTMHLQYFHTTHLKRTASKVRSTGVEIAIDEDAEDLDLLITPEERLRVAMVRHQIEQLV